MCSACPSLAEEPTSPLLIKTFLLIEAIAFIFWNHLSRSVGLPSLSPSSVIKALLPWSPVLRKGTAAGVDVAVAQPAPRT